MGRYKRGCSLGDLKRAGVDVSALREDAEGTAPGIPHGRACRQTIHAPGKMNRTEERYSQHLDLLKERGKIADWSFETIKLRLGPDWLTSYMPDFLVLLPDGVVEMHEVKGASKSKSSIKGAHWQEGSREKIKIAAGLFPFRFVAVHEERGKGWPREIFPPESEKRPAGS